MLQRKQFDDRSPRTVLPLLLEHLPGDRMQMFIAQRGSELVAAAVVFTGGDLAFYLYGASSSSALPLNAGYLLHWQIAAWLRERGVICYNLGNGFGGLRQFKLGMQPNSAA